MELDWKTVTFEVINFIALMLILGRFLFRPVREVMTRRRAEIEKARRDVEAARDETRGARETYEGKRRELEERADAELAAARARGEAAAQAIVDGARADAQRLLSAAEAEVEAAERRALEGLRPRIARLAADATAQLLRDADGRALTQTFAERAASELRASLPEGGGPIAVKAWISGDADEAAIVAILRRALGPRATIEALRDPALIAGVRLVAAGVEIDASASGTLDRWLAAHAEASGVQAA